MLANHPVRVCLQCRKAMSEIIALGRFPHLTDMKHTKQAKKAPYASC